MVENTILNAAAIVAFAATADAEASRMFCDNILKLCLVADEPYVLVFDANGTTLWIQKVQNVMAVHYATLGWNVEDIVALHDILATAGET